MNYARTIVYKARKKVIYSKLDSYPKLRKRYPKYDPLEFDFLSHIPKKHKKSFHSGTLHVYNRTHNV